MLYEPTQFEPPIDEPWDQARVEAAISEIVADADATFDIDALWPALAAPRWHHLPQSLGP